MNLFFSDQQNMLRETIAKMLADESAPARIRASEEKAFDPQLWNTLCEMGIPLMRLSEANGGADASLLDAVIVAEEAGRRLASVPLLEHMAAAGVLEKLGTEGAAWLKRVVNDGLIVTLALQDAAIAPTQIVAGASSAHAVLYRRGDAVAVHETGQRFDKAENLGALDAARRTFAATDPVLARGQGAVDALLAGIEEWRLLRAAYMGGLCSEALVLAAGYAKERMQFGQPVGSFQGVSHPLADSMADVDGLRLLALKATSLVAKRDPEAGAWIAKAAWWSADAARRCLQRAVHSYGGYGLTLEYDIQLYFRRGRAWSIIEGDPIQFLNAAARRRWLGEKVPLPDAGACEVDFDWSADAEVLMQEARAFFEKHMTPEVKATMHHSTAGHNPTVHRQLAAAGLLYPAWPKEWGGRDASVLSSAALGRVFEHYRYSRVMIAITNIIGLAVMRLGTKEAQDEILPAIINGEKLACLGFSEPGAGSDVFATRTRAVREGDGWVISGQKMFTTGGHLADYIILLTRTTVVPGKNHQGLTIFVVPMKTPGVEVQAVKTLQDERTNITFLNDVHLSDRYRLGEVDKGTAVMNFLLTLEHGGEGYHIFQNSLMESALEWVRAPSASGTPRLAEPETQRRIARAAIHTEISDLLCRRAIWAGDNKIHNRYFGPMAKLYTTETYVEDSAELLELMAPDSLFSQPAPIGEIEQKHRQSIGTRIYGGTSQVHRSLIAEQGLGLPRTRA